MSRYSRSLFVLLALLTLAGTAAADVTVNSFDRANWVLISECDEPVLLESELEWGLYWGEFSSNLLVSRFNTVVAMQHSVVEVEGDEIRLTGSLSAHLTRDESGACESAQAESWIILGFTPAEDSIMSIDNQGFYATGPYSSVEFRVQSHSTGDLIFIQPPGDYQGSVELEGGTEYLLSIRVLCQADGEDAGSGSATCSFDVEMMPAGSVAVESASLSGVKALFQP